MEITIEMLLKEILRLQATQTALAEVLMRDYNIKLPPDWIDLFHKYQIEYAPRLGLQIIPHEMSSQEPMLKPNLRLVRKEDE
ncbi:hypothetical protein LSG31_00745 [Fodinisporobacter ferrooxydans]|uniref:Uncharacterized protein n=1 Tax=Fodinisporobacter ferrooxydans TaxID=2901836 RepID=A0ABY4CNN4_9BACL|nr:hypothetical protein LSG31_00745 [Alicyclobacillaceae bacterium MYW30-H2]